MSSTRSTCGVLRARSVVASCFASRITIASAAGRSTSSPCSKIWPGSDSSPTSGFEPLLRQSDTPAVYEQALDRLRESTDVYACECSRKDIGGERYDGRCRERRLEPGSGRGIRVQLPDGDEVFDDALLGRQTQTPAEQCGDLLVRDRDGHWTYQFAVTVDDVRQGVTLVIRGADLVSSTGRQILLARMLGRKNAPVFLHHPLIHDGRGEKLSKSAGDTGVRELRSAGLTAPEVIGIAAARVGLLNPGESIRASMSRASFGPRRARDFVRNPESESRVLAIESSATRSAGISRGDLGSPSVHRKPAVRRKRSGPQSPLRGRRRALPRRHAGRSRDRPSARIRIRRVCGAHRRRGSDSKVRFTTFSGTSACRQRSARA